MFFQRIAVLVSAFLLLILTGCGGGMLSQGEERLPAISTTTVETEDVVDLAVGKPTQGSPRFAHRTERTVWWFASEENRKAFELAPANYRFVRSYENMAFFGADIVARFPEGINSPTLGPVVGGNLREYRVEYKGAMFAFASAENRDKFKKDPGRYIPPVGGYCLGAMSLDRVTPGDPRQVLFIAGATSAVFGSSNGPRVWGAMTVKEQEGKAVLAQKNYLRRSGGG